MNNALTSRFPAVPLRISRDSLKATLMPGSLSTGRPFFSQRFDKGQWELVAYDSTANDSLESRSITTYPKRYLLVFLNDEVQISTKIEIYRIFPTKKMFNTRK